MLFLVTRRCAISAPSPYVQLTNLPPHQELIWFDLAVDDGWCCCFRRHEEDRFGMYRRGFSRLCDVSKKIIRGGGRRPPNSEETTPSAVSFLIDPTPLVAAFTRTLEGSGHVYLKGAVHEGKSSFARTYCEVHPKNTCYVSCNIGRSPEALAAEVIDALHMAGHESVKKLSDVKRFDGTFTFFFDQCHLLFRHSLDSDVAALFVQRSSLRAKVVYLSTTQYGATADGALCTPASITNKWVLPWRFSREEVRALVPCILENTATPSGTCGKDAAKLIFSLFTGHRGMTVMALEYIRQNQVGPADMSFQAIHQALRTMLLTHEGALQSRACKINGQNALRYPRGYAHNQETLVQLALSTGKIPASVVDKVPHDIQYGVTLGAFTPFNLWSIPTTATNISATQRVDYGIPNPFLLRELDRNIGPWDFRVVPRPSLSAEAVITGLSHLAYGALFGIGGDKTVRDDEVWYEDDLNRAVRAGMNKAYDGLIEFVPCAAARGPQGKPDIFSGDEKLVIECVVYSKLHKYQLDEHYCRFNPKGWKVEYQKGLKPGHSALLVIFCGSAEVDEVVAATQRPPPTTQQTPLPPATPQTHLSLKPTCLFGHDFSPQVPVLIVVINWASLWEFEVQYLEKSKAIVETKVRTDMQCWSFDVKDRLFFVSSKPSKTLEEKVEKLKPDSEVPKNVWVQQLDGQPLRLTGSAFQVTPSLDNVDGLKKAIKAKKPSLKDVDADRLTIYTKAGTGQWISIVKQSTALNANTAPTPYGFALPQGGS